MRRRVAALAAALLLTGALAGPTVAAGPVHTTGGPMIDQQFEDMCSFPIHWYEDGSTMQAITFPVQANGDQVFRFTGPMVSILTNQTNDQEITVWSNLRMDMVVHPDGTSELYGAGKVVVGYRAVDDGGPGLWLLEGRLHDSVAADMVTVTTHYPFVGRLVDLCELLK